MSLLSPHQIATLTQRMNLFQPSGFNDELRRDLTEGAAFAAVDGENISEIDDGFRIRQTRNGGFLLQVAIADGSQVDYESEQLQGAMDAKASIYQGRRVVRSLLDKVVVQQLELRPGPEPRRALVVESRFDADAQPIATSDIFPAFVRVDSYSYSRFVANYLPRHGGKNSPIVQFEETFRNNRADLQPGLPVALGGSKQNVIYGNHLNQDCMVLTNLGVAGMAVEAEVPLLHRRFPTAASIWSSGKAVSTDKNLYIVGDHQTPDTGVPYARTTSPMHDGVSLANHILLGAYIAEEDPDILQVMAQEMHQQLTS